MSRAEWLGYTPMTSEAEAWLTRLWRQHDLPEEPTFSRWSLEYSREIYEVVATFTKPDVVAGFEQDGGDARAELLKMLVNMDVWDNDPKSQQWVPMDWKPLDVEDPPRAKTP